MSLATGSLTRTGSAFDAICKSDLPAREGTQAESSRGCRGNSSKIEPVKTKAASRIAITPSKTSDPLAAE
ncbi:hypothetical protein [Bradyrhizobium sp. Leo121]|uniref:hypothetical protein n=1 Tax=Bradyrhizobium sp. Leo121 TaxID=1571195 RepID=UPI001A930D5F|nr:hypothetical protein [Bradyrhizobium sp. Leo121]